MIEEEIREAILNLLESKTLSTKEILDKSEEFHSDKDRILIQLIILEKSKLIEKESFDIEDPLMGSRWKVAPKWKELLKKEVKITNKESIPSLQDSMLVVTIPPEFGLESQDKNLMETRDALALLFSSAKKTIRISTPYIDEILRLFSSVLLLNAPKELEIKLMTISQDDAYGELRLERTIKDLKNRFKNTKISKFEKKDNFNRFIFKTHAKVIIVDDVYLFVTSANLMRTSYLDNFEMGFITKDKELIKTATIIYDRLFI